MKKAKRTQKLQYKMIPSRTFDDVIREAQEKAKNLPPQTEQEMKEAMELARQAGVMMFFIR